MTRTRPRILLVDDSPALRGALRRALSAQYLVEEAESAAKAIGLLAQPPAAVLLDLRLDEEDPTNCQALELLGRVKQELPGVPVLVITAYGDIETAVECMRLGAVDFIQKSTDLRELRARIEKALQQSRVLSRLRQLETELAIVEPRELVGASTVMAGVKEMIAAVARDGQVTVLVTGETGTGKELVARAIHASGPRAGGQFVAVAIAALPQTMVEAELFGYEPGAFTGAQRRHQGFFERAGSGVLFLDEIGELPPATQVRLLRVLEERTVSRLGSRKETPVDVQVVAASNADLPELMRQGQFREDLYYRLKVCEIRVAPLRERVGDVPLMVEHFLTRLGERARGVAAVSPDAMAALVRYAWPGNVRELRNAVEAALLKATLRGRTAIQLEDLPSEVRTPESVRLAGPPASTCHEGFRAGCLDEALARAELDQVEWALREAGGRKSAAWKLLGLNDRFTFTRRVRRLIARYPGIAASYADVVKAFARDEPVQQTCRAQRVWGPGYR